MLMFRSCPIPVDVIYNLTKVRMLVAVDAYDLVSTPYYILDCSREGEVLLPRYSINRAQ